MLEHGGVTGSPGGESERVNQESGRVRFKVDSDIEFQYPDKTSGYVSDNGASSSPGVDKQPQLGPGVGRAVHFSESTPLRDFVSVMPSRAVGRPVTDVADVSQSFLFSQNCTEQGRKSSNPFLQDGDVVNPKKLHSELLSFATRPVGEAGSILPERKAQPSVMAPTTSMSHWPMQRESRIIVDEDGGSLERKCRRPNIIPDRYKGKILWKEYFQHFESCREVNGWNEEQAARYLSASLQGDALRMFGDVSLGRRRTYGELVKLLERRFGSGRQSENYLVELRHRRQGSKENLQELGQAIHELVVRAYPDVTADWKIL